MVVSCFRKSLAPMWCNTIHFAKNKHLRKNDIVPLTPQNRCQRCFTDLVDRFLEDPHGDRQLRVSGLQGVEQTWWFDKKLRIPGAEGNLGNKRTWFGRHADVCQVFFFVNLIFDVMVFLKSSFFEFGLNQLDNDRWILLMYLLTVHLALSRCLLFFPSFKTTFRIQHNQTPKRNTYKAQQKGIIQIAYNIQRSYIILYAKEKHV